MLEKHTLSEEFLITGKIDKVSSINAKLIRNHLLSNYLMMNRYKDDQYWYMKEYLKIPYHQHIQWIQDYLRDHFRLKHGKTLVPTPVDSIRGIIQQQGDVVNTHHNVKDWHLEESPDVSCLYCVGTGEKNSKMIFEYDDGRNKHRRWSESIEENKFILYSSHTPISITKNENRDFLVNLSLHFQLI